MTKDSLNKKIEELGLGNTLLYYLGRLCAKAEMVVIGRWTQKFCRVHENRLVFKNRQMQDFTDNTRAFFEYLIQNGYNEKYELIWLVSNPGKYRKLHYKNVKFFTAENRHGWNSCRAYYYAATAKYFFYTNHTADLNRYYCKGQQTINLWHGCGYKGSTLDRSGIPHSDTMGKFDYALVPGPVFVETKSAYWYCEKEKILPLGYPRYDWMLRPSCSKAEMLEKLFGWKNPSAKVVIWMPTFRKSSQQGYGENEIELPYELPAMEGPRQMKELDGFLQEQNLLLIIKKHPLQIGWTKEPQSYSNICYVNEELLEKAGLQLYELVGGCDALISDYSSIAVDFLLLDRPLGFVLTDLELYGDKRGFVFENPLDYMPGEKIYNYHELQNFLRHVKNGEDDFAQERQRLMPLMHRQTAQYSRRLAEFLHIEK